MFGTGRAAGLEPRTASANTFASISEPCLCLRLSNNLLRPSMTNETATAIGTNETQRQVRTKSCAHRINGGENVNRLQIAAVLVCAYVAATVILATQGVGRNGATNASTLMHTTISIESRCLIGAALTQACVRRHLSDHRDDRAVRWVVWQSGVV